MALQEVAVLPRGKGGKKSGLNFLPRPVACVASLPRRTEFLSLSPCAPSQPRPQNSLGPAGEAFPTTLLGTARKDGDTPGGLTSPALLPAERLGLRAPPPAEDTAQTPPALAGGRVLR